MNLFVTLLTPNPPFSGTAKGFVTQLFWSGLCPVGSADFDIFNKISWNHFRVSITKVLKSMHPYVHIPFDLGLILL
jgi:hypothetical protein